MNPILIIGATGFLGKHLVAKFLEEFTPTTPDFQLTLLVRNEKKIPTHWKKHKNIKIISGDLEKIESLKKLQSFMNKQQVDCFYLAHAMEHGADFQEREKLQVTNFTTILKTSLHPQQHRVLYLGGLFRGKEQSLHRQSREQVGIILRKTQAIIIEIKASLILAHDSSSFLLMRALVWRFPFFIKASWTNALCRPVDLEDLLVFLQELITQKHLQSTIYEIGGCEERTYLDLLKLVAEVENLPRAILPFSFIPKDILLKVFPFFLPEFKNLGQNLMASLEVDSTFSSNLAHQQKILSNKTLKNIIERIITKNHHNVKNKSFLNLLQDHSKEEKFLFNSMIDAPFERWIATSWQLEMAFDSFKKNLETSLKWIPSPIKESLNLQLSHDDQRVSLYFKLSFHQLTNLGLWQLPGLHFIGEFQKKFLSPLNDNQEILMIVMPQNESDLISIQMGWRMIRT